MPTKASFSISVLFGLLATFGVVTESATGQAAGAEQHRGPVTVKLAGGRSFTAKVDPRTDETRLWLRWSHETISVLRPIHWERVVQAEFDGKPVSGDELRRAVAQPREPVPKDGEAHARRTKTFHVHCWPPTRLHSARSTRAAPDAATITAIGADHPETPPVRSLAIDAWVANWDRDVEVDGLVVEVHPLDASGAVVPVHGTLEVNLIGWRTGMTRSRQPAVRLGRWTRLVRPNEFIGLGAEYRLPFQAVHPEFDLQWAARATVHARLSVPGQGVFETTESTVRVRPYSAVRDHLQQTTGQRFFPLERTGRGRH